MFDVSKIPPFVLVGVLGLTLFIYVVCGLKAGAKKKLIDISLLGVLIASLIYLAPNLAYFLEGNEMLKGVIDKISSVLPAEAVDLVLTIFNTSFYVLMAGLVIIALYLLIRLVVGIIYRLRNKRKGVFNRLFGGIINGAVGACVCVLILVTMSSRALFGDSGVNLIENTPVVSEVYVNIQKGQDYLKGKGIPYDIESICAKLILDDDATPEDLVRYTETISRMPVLIEELENGIAAEKYLNEDGSLNQENVVVLVDDSIVILELIGRMPDEKQEGVKQIVEGNLEEFRHIAFNDDETPKAVIQVTQEQKDSLNEALNKLNMSEKLINSLNQLLVA